MLGSHPEQTIQTSLHLEKSLDMIQDAGESNVGKLSLARPAGPLSLSLVTVEHNGAANQNLTPTHRYRPSLGYSMYSPHEIHGRTDWI